MKKQLILLFSLISSLFASPVLAPNLPELFSEGIFIARDYYWSLRTGFRGDYVFNRYLRGYERYNLFANEGVLTLNLLERLDLYGFLGAASHSSSTSVEEIVYETRSIWGCGLRIFIYETTWGCCGTTYFGMDANYERLSKGNPNWTLVNGVAISNALSSHFREWQVAFQIGQRFNRLTPYLAIKWSGAREELSNSVSTRSARHFGYVVGATLIDSDLVAITAEARFVDETAMTVMGEFRF